MHSARSQPSPHGREGPHQPKLCPAPAPTAAPKNIIPPQAICAGSRWGAQRTQLLLPGACPRPWLYSCCSFISMSDTRMFFSVASPGPEALLRL